jgi:H+/Cl- antiporter ClcA
VDLGAVGRVLVLASAGALLVAFLGSLIPIAIPLLIAYQRTQRLQLAAVVAIALAGLAAWGTVWVVHGDHHGYGSIPSAAVHARDYAAAVVLGVIAVAIGALLRWFIKRLAVVTKRIDDHAPWWLAAAVFGLVLGVLYLVGGQTVQFSGSEGSVMLLSGDMHYGTWALAGIAVVKLAATSWSLTAGYRGGLVFPSVFAGVAVSLLVAGALPDLAGPGVLLGSVAGLLVEMTAPMLGVVMLLALLPAKLLPLGIAGAAGAIAGRLAVTRLQPPDGDRAG